MFAVSAIYDAKTWPKLLKIQVCIARTHIEEQVTQCPNSLTKCSGLFAQIVKIYTVKCIFHQTLYKR